MVIENSFKPSCLEKEKKRERGQSSNTPFRGFRGHRSAAWIYFEKTSADPLGPERRKKTQYGRVSHPREKELLQRTAGEL